MESRDRILSDLANALDYLGRIDEADPTALKKEYGDEERGFTSGAIVQDIISDLYDYLEAASGTARVTAGSSPGRAAEHRGVPPEHRV